MVKNGWLEPNRHPVNNYRFFSRTALKEFKDRLPGIRRAESRRTRPPQKIEFSFIDLFAGTGGLRIPFDELGGRCVFTSEIDKYAVKTYRQNFKSDNHNISGDITAISADEVPNHDLLIAGFPCQPFSLAGVSKKNSLNRPHGFEDPTRGTLFFDIKRLLDYHRPPAFLLENVKHLRNHDRGRTYRVIKESLEGLGYKIHTRVIDAANFVPQHRERIFIVGFDRDVPFDFPESQVGGPVLRSILSNHALVDPKYTLSDHLWSYLQGYAEKHRKKGNGFGYSLAPIDGVTRTLSARYHKDGSEILIDQGRGMNPRRLTPEECLKLMGFPDSFSFPDDVSDTQRYRQMGNAVVVPAVRPIAQEMIATLAEHYPPLAQSSLFDHRGAADLVA